MQLSWEILGLMAIHLILLPVNKCNPDLSGSVQIFSDCLGALNKMANLPPYRIPTKCSHSDILKNIMVHCSDLTFRRLYSHVKAHQDDNIQYGDLSPSQTWPPLAEMPPRWRQYPAPTHQKELGGDHWVPRPDNQPTTREGNSGGQEEMADVDERRRNNTALAADKRRWSGWWRRPVDE